MLIFLSSSVLSNKLKRKLDYILVRISLVHQFLLNLWSPHRCHTKFMTQLNTCSSYFPHVICISFLVRLTSRQQSPLLVGQQVVFENFTPGDVASCHTNNIPVEHQKE